MISKKREEKRIRKSTDQTCHLMKLFHKTKGDPSRRQITEIASQLDLKEIQVYKWMWDTQQRQDRNTQELLESQYPFTTIFNIDHKDGKGNYLTPY